MTKNLSDGADSGAIALRMLASLAEASYPLSADDLWRESGATSAAARRALKALLSEGFATADTGSGQYVVGPKFTRIAQFSRGNPSQERELRPILRELAVATGETVTFNTYASAAKHALCVMIEDSPAPLHYVVEVGELKPLHAGSSGKVILAFLSDEEIDTYIAESGLPPATGKTTTDPNKLWRELRRIRRQGFAITRGQRLEGAVAIGGPVFGAAGRIHASVVLTIPAHRYRAVEQAETTAAVINAAARLSAIITAGESR